MERVVSDTGGWWVVQVANENAPDVARVTTPSPLSLHGWSLAEGEESLEEERQLRRSMATLDA